MTWLRAFVVIWCTVLSSGLPVESKGQEIDQIPLEVLIGAAPGPLHMASRDQATVHRRAGMQPGSYPVTSGYPVTARYPVTSGYPVTQVSANVNEKQAVRAPENYEPGQAGSHAVAVTSPSAIPSELAGSLENQPVQPADRSPATTPEATLPVQNATSLPVQNAISLSVQNATSLPVQNATASSTRANSLVQAAQGVAEQITLVGTTHEVLPGPPRDPRSGEDEVTVSEEGFDSLDRPNYLWGDIRNACGSCCESGLFIGVEGLYLAPFDEPEHRVTFTDLVTSDSYSGASNPSLGTGVRTWIGLQDCGRGFRISYTYFGNENIKPIPSVPINAQPSFLETYHLKASSLDVELTHAFRFCTSEYEASLGARYASLQRNGTTVGYGTVGDVNLLGVAMGANKIEGTGFTGMLGARKPLGGNCGWYGFWRYRGSLLWADSTASVLTEANAVIKAPVGAAAANSQDKASASKDHNECVFISEVQLGVQYCKPLCCSPALFYFRAAVEYQLWRTGDVFAESNSFASLAGGPPLFGGQVDATSRAHDGGLDMFGLVIGAGITF